MRRIHCSLPAIALIGACAAPGVGQIAPAPVAIELAVPQDRGPQVVHVVTRDVPPGGEIPWHTHPGVEIGYVESGEVEFLSGEEPARRLGHGKTFLAERGVVHCGRNPGRVPARIVITYVVDRDAPLRTPADPPQAR